MKGQDKYSLLLGLSFIFILSGCVVRTYSVTKERQDQDLSEGNRGYLEGEASEEGAEERKATRTTQVVEIEFHSPVRFEKAPKAKPEQKTEEKMVQGNRGLITESSIPEISEPKTVVSPASVNIEKYTVQKGDTLQKLAKEFYGTTKKWTKIYEANKDILKGPDKVYPGQVINIPLEPLKETKENLK